VPRSNELRSALLAAGIRGRTTNPITELLGCYAAGDRGAPGVFDRCENERALREGLRIFSAYETPTGSVRINTDVTDAAGPQRSTCILHPKDY
jgi:hypothetical protein